jgi:hypothetical protein
MPREELTPTDRLLFGVEQALDQSGSSPSGDPSMSAELLASRGLAGLTSVYVESFRAIDQLPKVFSVRRFGKTALSGEARDLMQFVDESIELNPLYHGDEYSFGKTLLDNDYAYSLFGMTESAPPAGYLTDRRHEDQFAERGLAAMYQAVHGGLSARHPSVDAVRLHSSENLQKTMTLNKSIDPDVMNALAQARREGEYTPQEYIAGLVTLAENTTRALIDTPKGKELVRRSNGDEIITLRDISGNVVALGTGATTGLAVIESILVFESPHTMMHIAAALTSAAAALILRRVGANIRGETNSQS